MTANFANVLRSLGSPRILVVGDLILDRYTWGNAERVSPEAPVLVLDADAREVRLGGAASVASLLRGLNVPVTVAGVLGDDPAARVVRDLFDQAQIDHGLALEDPSRPTTTKERFIGRAASRHPHQILRVDYEAREPLPSEWTERLGQPILARLADHQALLISDYHKGVCTPQLLAALVAGARARGLPVLVDPARIADYSRYRGATLLAPNRAETGLAVGRPIRTPDDAMDAGRRLCQSCGVDALVVKLDSDGMVIAHADSPGLHVATRPRPVHDVTGAGDMVLAVLGLCLCTGVPLSEAARVANIAAGLEVERLGVALVSRDELLHEILGDTGTDVDATGRLHDAGRPERRERPSRRREEPTEDAVHAALRPGHHEVVGGRGAESEGDESPVSHPEHEEKTLRGAAERPKAAPAALPQVPARPAVSPKLVTLDEMQRLAESYRRAGRTIVCTNGCFDLLHVGHAAYLQEASRMGDVLLVAVNSDRSVRAIKGRRRPIVGEDDRAAMLAALACVDHVLIFDEETPHGLLRRVRPDVLVKGGTYAPDGVVGREVVESYGGRVAVTASVPSVSTTAIVASILTAHSG